MTPQQDQRDVGLSGAESHGYFGLGHRASQRSDFGDFFRRQEFLEHGDSTDVDGVLPIALVGSPLEVVRRTVLLAAVDVVDDREIERIGDEGQSHEPMDVDCLASPIPPQTDLWIPNFVGSRSENLAVASLRAIQPHSHAVKAPHRAKITDFVEPIELVDGSPFFNQHHMGPFARSAHSTVAFDAIQGG